MAALIDVAAVSSGRWTDPATWSGGTVPLGSGYRAVVDGDGSRQTTVTVDQGVTVGGIAVGGAGSAAADEVLLPGGRLTVMADPAAGSGVGVLNDGMIRAYRRSTSTPGVTFRPVVRLVNTGSGAAWLPIEGGGTLSVAGGILEIGGAVRNGPGHKIVLSDSRLMFGASGPATLRNEGLLRFRGLQNYVDGGTIQNAGELRVDVRLFASGTEIAGGRVSGNYMQFSSGRLTDVSLELSLARLVKGPVLERVQLAPGARLEALPNSGGVLMTLVEELRNEGVVSPSPLGRYIALEGTAFGAGDPLVAGWEGVVLSGRGTFRLSGQRVVPALGRFRFGSPEPDAVWLKSGQRLEGAGTIQAGIYNQGSIVQQGAASLTLQGYAPGARVIGRYPVLNAGLVWAAGGGGIDIQHREYIQVGGETRVETRMSSNRPMRIERGRLTGPGSISAPQVVVGDGVGLGDAMIAPGASPGRMGIDGDLLLGADAILEIELAGLNQGLTYDWLDVTGSAALDGWVRVLLDGAFAPAVGDVFTFLTAAGGVSGSFTGLEILSPAGVYGMELLYGTGSVSLRVTALPGSGGGSGSGPGTASVPLPGTLTLVAMGGLLAALRGRRWRAADGAEIGGAA